MSLPQIDTRSSLMRHSPSLIVGMSTSMNSKSLRPTNCAAFIRLSTSHKNSAPNIPGSPSATPRFFRGSEPDSVGAHPMLDGHSIVRAHGGDRLSWHEKGVEGADGPSALARGSCGSRNMCHVG